MADMDLIPAEDLCDDSLKAHIKRVDERIEKGFSDHGGSPGEFWYERADELHFEKLKRGI